MRCLNFTFFVCNLIRAKTLSILKWLALMFSFLNNLISNFTSTCIIYLSWAYHVRHFLTAARYGVQSPQFNEQGIGYVNGNPVPDLNSNLNLLEDFSPSRTADPFRWIPQGLFYDMIDVRNDFGVTGNSLLPADMVGNYRKQQFFDALDSDISSLSANRERLIGLNPNNQTADIRSLFLFSKY